MVVDIGAMVVVSTAATVVVMMGAVVVLSVPSKSFFLFLNVHQWEHTYTSKSIIHIWYPCGQIITAHITPNYYVWCQLL